MCQLCEHIDFRQTETDVPIASQPKRCCAFYHVPFARPGHGKKTAIAKQVAAFLASLVDCGLRNVPQHRTGVRGADAAGVPHAGDIQIVQEGVAPLDHLGDAAHRARRGMRRGMSRQGRINRQITGQIARKIGQTKAQIGAGSLNVAILE